MYGDKLYVVINGDDFTEKYKRRPIYSEHDRKAIIESLSCVDTVDISNSSDIKPFIEKYDINTVLHGDDWEHESYLKQICCTQEYLDTNNITIEYTSYYPGISTSEILKRVQLLKL